MKPDKYILIDRVPVPEYDLFKWGRWLEKSERTIKRTKIGDALISTVFLGLDHNWGDGEPVLFETMVFGGKMDSHMRRYTSYDAALTGHKRVVKLVKGKRDTK